MRNENHNRAYIPFAGKKKTDGLEKKMHKSIFFAAKNLENMEEKQIALQF